MAQPTRNHVEPLVLDRGVPPASSYWIGCDRAELARRIEERRHQQALPGTKIGIWDPAPDAERSIRATLAVAKLRADKRRAETARLRAR